MGSPSKTEKLVVVVKDKMITKRLRHARGRACCNNGYAKPAVMAAVALIAVIAALCIAFAGSVLTKSDNTVGLSQATRMTSATTTVKPVSPNEQQGDNATAPEGNKESSTKTIKKTLQTADGKEFTVTVTFDESAGIPDDAELSIIEYNLEPQKENWQEDSEYADRPYETERFLSKGQMDARVEALSKGVGVQDDDYVFYSKFLDINIVSDEGFIQPKSDIDVTIETDAIDRAAASSMEIASLKSVDSKTHKKNFELRETEDKTTKDDGVKFEFSAGRMGEFGIAGVAVPKTIWQIDGYDATVLGPRNATVYLSDAYVNEAGDGMQLLEAMGAQVDPDPSYGTALWLRTTALSDDESQSAFEGYLIEDGALGKKLFTYEKDAAPVSFDSGDGIAFVSEAATNGNEATSEEVAGETSEESDATDSALSDLPEQIQQSVPLFGMLQGQALDEGLLSAQASSDSLRVQVYTYENGDFANATLLREVDYTYSWGWSDIPMANIVTSVGGVPSEYQVGPGWIGDDHDVVSVKTDRVNSTYKKATGEEKSIPEGAVLKIYCFKRDVTVPVYYVKEKADGTLEQMTHEETQWYGDYRDSYNSLGIHYWYSVVLSTSDGVNLWTPVELPQYVDSQTHDIHHGSPLKKFGFGKDGLCGRPIEELAGEIEETDSKIYIRNTPNGVVASPNEDLTDGMTFTDSSLAIYVIYEDGSEPPICKIGNQGFTTLRDAMNTVRAGTPTTIEMLVDYAVPQDDTLTINSGYDVTLTTAAKSNTQLPYRGSGTRATLTRASGNTNPLITVKGESAKTASLTLNNIAFDGGDTQIDSGGGIVYAQYAHVTFSGTTKDDGVLIENSKSKKEGGAVYTKNCWTQIEYATFNDCSKVSGGGDENSKNNGGGAIWAAGEYLIISNCSFTNCASDRAGGAVASTATLLEVTSSEFVGCKATTASAGEGGAISHQSPKCQITTKVDDCTFLDCSSEKGSGGAIQARALIPSEPGGYAVNVTNSSFEGCYAGKQGGGLNYFEGASMYVSGCTFKNCWNQATAADKPGGAVCAVRAKDKVDLFDCQFIGCYTVRDDSYGGGFAVNYGSCTASVTGCSFQDCRAGSGKAKSKGGAIYTDVNTTITNTSIEGHTTGNDLSYEPATSKNADQGGGIYINSNRTTIQGTGSVESCRASYGGAIYVKGGAVLDIKGGTITGNTSSAEGAGIYLPQGAALNLQGSPDFGGPGVDGNGNIDPEVGNLKDGSLSTTNGWKPYTKARQDIYLAEANEAPASINLVGDLTSANGSIWVWADKSNHYEQGKPFAKMDRSELTSANNLAAFRNARGDSSTKNSYSTYLYGSTGSNDMYVYWEGAIDGSRDVILKKIGNDNKALEGAQFLIYKQDGTTLFTVTENGETKSAFESDEYGVYYVGTMPFGVYYINEIRTPAGYQSNGETGWWYTLTVSEDGATISEQLSEKPKQ